MSANMLELSFEDKGMLVALATTMLRLHLIGGDMSEAPALLRLALPPGSVKAASASGALICPEYENLVNATSVAPAVTSIVISATFAPASAPLSGIVGSVIARGVCVSINTVCLGRLLDFSSHPPRHQLSKHNQKR